MNYQHIHKLFLLLIKSNFCTFNFFKHFNTKNTFLSLNLFFPVFGFAESINPKCPFPSTNIESPCPHLKNGHNSNNYNANLIINHLINLYEQINYWE